MALKVFNLQCDAGHLFEGWFGSHDDYDEQQAQGLISCPLCHSAHVQKMPSAPRIQSGRSTEAPTKASVHESSSALASLPAKDMARLQAQFLSQMRQAVSGAEDVGVAFAEQARAIHEGQAPARPIRGVATEQERQELVEDGVEFMVLPDFLNDDRLQ